MSAQTPKHITSTVKESYSKQFLDHSKKQHEYTHPATQASAAAGHATRSACILHIAGAWQMKIKHTAKLNYDFESPSKICHKTTSTATSKMPQAGIWVGFSLKQICFTNFLVTLWLFFLKVIFKLQCLSVSAMGRATCWLWGLKNIPQNGSLAPRHWLREAGVRLLAGKCKARFLQLSSQPGISQAPIWSWQWKCLAQYLFLPHQFVHLECFSQEDNCRNADVCNAQLQICCLLRFWEPSIVCGPL